MAGSVRKRQEAARDEMMTQGRREASGEEAAGDKGETREKQEEDGRAKQGRETR